MGPKHSTQRASEPGGHSPTLPGRELPRLPDHPHALHPPIAGGLSRKQKQHVRWGWDRGGRSEASRRLQPPRDKLHRPSEACGARAGGERDEECRAEDAGGEGYGGGDGEAVVHHEEQLGC
ncbi:hypothetical protein PIB30_069400 [Stylosanthes scabra]|uniref:Uncharacterized protein n=1 Tax=Stylosanthes scabra TaxID=79078 RepID=A0ABU6SNR3_9FABA|nr:hypothetical protein [Stylosanthes scabra]